MCKSYTYFLTLFLIFSFESGFSQDVILLKNGEQLTGSYKINYKESGDELVSEDGSAIIHSVDIEEYIKDGVTTFKAKNLIFYSNSKREEEQKTVLIEQALVGEANLYLYNGAEFDLVLENGDLLNVLQELPPNINLENVQNYKITLLTMLGDCMEREEIFSASLSINEMISIVNTYNRCSNPDYIPIREAPKKEVVYNFSFGLGINTANLELSTPIQEARNTGIQQVGFINSEDKPSNTLAGSLGFNISLLGSETLYFDAKIGFRKLNFGMFSEEVSLSPNNIDVSEITLNTGLNYRFLKDKKVSPELSTGIFLWVLSSSETIYWARSSGEIALPSGARKDNGLGFYFQPGLSFDLFPNASLILNASYSQRATRNVFINDKSKFLLPSEIESDKLSHNLTYMIGFRLKIIQERFVD